MKIGIDIDGVLTNIEQFTMDYLSKYCVENKIDYKIGDSNYQLAKTFYIDEKQEESFWEQYLEFYAKTEKARPFAAKIIKELKEEGHEIYIITARYLTNQDNEKGNHMKAIVKEWLFENEIQYDQLIFSKGDQERKLQEIVDYNIELMIEDSPENIKELSKIVPILCYDANYNKECKGTNITRCYSWYDIYDKISKISI